MSRTSFLKALKYLEIEEKILNIGALAALLGMFVPWFGGEWFGEPAVWTGFQFYTSFMGLLIFLGLVSILSLTILPLFGYQIIKPSLRDLLRLIISLECVLLTIAAWSVLTNISFDRSQMQIRFGIYVTLVGSIVASLYAFLRLQQERKRRVQELFHHPEDQVPEREKAIRQPLEKTPPPPPPPPSPDEPEEPRLL